MDIVLLWSLVNTLTFVFAAFWASITLSRKYNMALMTFYFLLFTVINFVVAFIVYSTNILNDTIVTCAQTALTCLGLYLFYRDNLEYKVFMGVTSILWCAVFTFMFCGTTDQILGGGLGMFDPVNGPYTVRNILFFGCIKTFVLTVVTVLYLYFLRDKVKDMMFQAKSQMKNYIFAPIVSLAAFIVINGVTNAAGILPTSNYFFPLYVSICLLYIVLFTEIYLSVHWASEAQKAGNLGRMDGLTGLNNRLAFEEEEKVIDEEIENEKAHFSIVMIDLNSLKHINDTYGHDKGDISIKILADYIQMIFVGCDNFRIGGDEFVVILRNSLVNSTSRLVKDLTKKMKDNKSTEEWRHISAAIGSAIYEIGVDRNFDEVFKRADDAMYKNKSEMKQNMM